MELTYEGHSEDPGYKEAKSWIDAIINNRDPIVMPEQALAVTEILEAIYESSRTGKPVIF